MPSGSCLSESVDIPLRSGQDSGWSEHDVRDRRSATWMSPRAVPVRIWDTISTSLGNSHSETLQLSEGILFVPGVRPVSQQSFTNSQFTCLVQLSMPQSSDNSEKYEIINNIYL